MNNSTKALALFTGLLMPACALAYTYTFNNKTNTDIEVKWQLVGIAEPIETLIIPANGKNSRSFDGLRIGLCMSTDSTTLSARKLKGGKPISDSIYPLIISRTSNAYAEFMKTNMVTSVDFKLEQPCKNFTGTGDAAVKCNPKKFICLNLEFEIHEAQDNHLVFILK